MLRSLTIRCGVARHADDGGAQYSSVHQLFPRIVRTRCTWMDPFRSGSFLSGAASQQPVRSQQSSEDSML